MKCVACGKDISNDALFCIYCGKKQEAPKPTPHKVYCNRCQKEFDSEMVFCDECGAKLQSTPKFKRDPDKEGLLLQIDMASFCEGPKPVGSKMSNGTVFFYEDRIETKTVLNNNPEVLVAMADIAEVSKGNYLSIWTSLTIRLKNGVAYTIAGVATGSSTIDRAIELIRQRIA